MALGTSLLFTEPLGLRGVTCPLLPTSSKSIPKLNRFWVFALEITRISLGLEDNFANGIIIKRLIELAKAGERNPYQLCEGAFE